MANTDTTITCAVWYWEHFVLRVELFDDDAEAADWAVTLERNGDIAVKGVQHPDGTYTPVTDWTTYQDVSRQRDEDEERWAAEVAARPTPAMRTIHPPFDSEAKARVPADAPTWLGR